jgi:hypothetical protein
MFFINRLFFLLLLTVCVWLSPISAQESVKSEIQLLLTAMSQAQLEQPLSQVVATYWLVDSTTLYWESLSDATLVEWYAPDLLNANAAPKAGSPATVQLSELKYTLNTNFAVVTFRETVKRADNITVRVAISTLELTSSGWKVHTIAYHAID